MRSLAIISHPLVFVQKALEDNCRRAVIAAAGGVLIAMRLYRRKIFAFKYRCDTRALLHLLYKSLNYFLHSIECFITRERSPDNNTLYRFFFAQTHYRLQCLQKMYL